MSGFTPTILRSLDGSITIEGGGAVDLRVSAGPGAGTFYIPPGANRTAAIETAILQGHKQLSFGDGTYLLESPLFAGITEAQASDVSINGIGDDRTVFTASYAPAVGQADVSTNALVLLQGAANGIVNTTVAAAIPAMNGSATFEVTSAVGIVAGMYLSLIAHNNPTNPTDMLDMSDGAGVVLTELVQVESVLGNVITLRSILKQWHTPGAAVASVTPITNVSIRSIYFNCSGGSIATAITAQLVTGLEVLDCSVKGFSRAGINLEAGTRDVEIGRLAARAELNSVLIGDSAMVVRAHGIVCDEEGARFHANGVARHAVKCLQRCTDWAIFDSLLQHMSGGVGWYGGVFLSLSRTKIRDMDPARIRVTDAVAYPPGAPCGAGIDGGYGPLGLESFGWDQRYADVEIHDCFGGVDDYAWFLHDARAVSIGGACGIWNHGPVWGTVVNGKTFRPQGFRCNDVIGSIESLSIYGCTYAFSTTGTPDLDIGVLRIDGTAGNGSSVIPFFFDHSVPSNLRIGLLNVQSFNSAETFYFGTQFTGSATPDYELWIDHFIRDTKEWADISIYRSDVILTQDAVAEIDAASPVNVKELIASTGPTIRNVAVASGVAANGFTFATTLPARIATVAVSGAGNAGDTLEANAAGQAVVNNAAAAGTSIGRLLVSKAAGVASVRIGSARA